MIQRKLNKKKMNSWGPLLKTTISFWQKKGATESTKNVKIMKNSIKIKSTCQTMFTLICFLLFFVGLKCKTSIQNWLTFSTTNLLWYKEIHLCVYSDFHFKPYLICHDHKKFIDCRKAKRSRCFHVTIIWICPELTECCSTHFGSGM